MTYIRGQLLHPKYDITSVHHVTRSLSARFLLAHTRWWRFLLLIWFSLINQVVIVLREPAQEVMSPPFQANASLDWPNLVSTRLMNNYINKDYLLMSIPGVEAGGKGF